MRYCLLHVSKSASIGKGLSNHIDRVTIPRNAYVDRVEENKHFLPRDIDVRQQTEKRIREALGNFKKIRKDAVRNLSYIMGGSPEIMENLKNKDELLAWAKANYEFLEGKHGKENILRFSLHMDEKTPHIHAVVVPLTADNRLSAKEVLGNKDDMKTMQDKYFERMRAFGFERGISNANRKHISTREFYRYVNENEITAEKLLSHPNAKELVGKLIDSDRNINETLKPSYSHERHFSANQLQRNEQKDPIRPNRGISH